jgi:predicted RNase H-like HicB family nuclease
MPDYGSSHLSKQTTLAVNVSHDKQEHVWYVLSSDIPGLHAEAETLDELVAVISDVAPDLIAANLPKTPTDTAISIQHMVNTKPARAA